MPKLIPLRLVLNLDVDPQGETTDHLKRQLHRVVSNAVNQGLLTGNTAATVEHYNYKVTVRRSVKKKVSAESQAIIDNYPNGLCPDCQWKIRRNVKEGDNCPNCEHVFYSADATAQAKEDAAETQRRDEKHGLYGGKQDVAN